MAGLDFKVEVRERDDGYELAVDSRAGGATMRAQRPFDELALKNRLLALENALLRSSGGRRVVPTDDEREVQEFGRQMFDWLLRDELRGRFDVSRSEAKQARTPLRIKLQIDSPTLAAVPWEFLYDSGRGDFLALSTNTPVVRFVEVAQPIEPLKVTPPLRMLAMVASPTDRPHLDAERERQRVTEATQVLQDSGLLEVHWLPGATRRDLVRALQAGPWHIFHFVGHGGFDTVSDEGVVALVDDQGAMFKLSARDLARMLGDHEPLRLAVLNACEGAKGSDHDLFSSTAASILRLGTPAVVAMQYEITDRAAIEFSKSFYQAVADGDPVDVAMSSARQAMAVSKTLEWGTPVLMMRSPDGRIFDVRKSRARKSSATAGASAAAAATAVTTAAGTSPDAGVPPVETATTPAPADAVAGEPARGSAGSAPPATGGTIPQATAEGAPPAEPTASSGGATAAASGGASSGLSGRVIAAGAALFLAGMAVVALLWAVLPGPGPVATPSLSPSPSPTISPTSSIDHVAVAESKLRTQVPTALRCRRTSGSNEQPNVDKEIIGLRCDLPEIGSNMYFLYDDPTLAGAAYHAGADPLAEGDCETGVPAHQEWERFQVFCRLGKNRAELGWLDEAKGIYGRLNGDPGSSIASLFAWWQRNAVLGDVADLVRGTQCEAVEWAATRGVGLSVSRRVGVSPEVVVSQAPQPGTQLDPSRAVGITVALDQPTRLLDLSGYDEDTSRRLLEVLGVGTVTPIYTGTPGSGAPENGVVLGTVPQAGSRVDRSSCVELVLSGTGPLTQAPGLPPPVIPAPTAAPSPQITPGLLAAPPTPSPSPPAPSGAQPTPSRSAATVSSPAPTAAPTDP